jgi:hypothetical protein
MGEAKRRKEAGVERGFAHRRYFPPEGASDLRPPPTGRVTLEGALASDRPRQPTSLELLTVIAAALSSVGGRTSLRRREPR